MVENLSEEHLQEFAHAGGTYIVVCLYGDDIASDNEKQIGILKLRCQEYRVKVGIWANYFGEDPSLYAAKVAALVHKYDIGPVMLDCEAAVQGNTLMAQVSKAIRLALPTRDICVSTNSLNDSVVYNGRIEGELPISWRSFIDLGIRVSPQWYSSYADGTCPGCTQGTPWADPEQNMAWLQAHGNEDNLRDMNAPGMRAVPKSYVKGTVEVTGMENSKIQTSLDSMLRAKAQGNYTFGLLTYLLENTPASDWPLIAAVRGRLYR